jgi:hypothetical protein
MKHLFAALLLLTLAGSTAMAAVDPGLLALVTPDAKALVGVQVAQTQASPFGQYLISQIPNDANVNKVMTAIGFDPRRDIQEILAATGDNPSTGVVLGRGSFQPARITAAATLAGAVATKYRGFEILSGTGINLNGTAGSVAFLDGSIMAIGDISAVKAAIDRRAAATVFSGPLADRAKQISASNDIWFASLTPPSGALGGGPGNGQANAPGNPFFGALQSALQASGGIKFAASGVTISAEVLARSPQDAQSMVDVVRFGASMVQMNRNKGGGASQAASLLDSATFSTSGSVAHISLLLPETQVEQLFMPKAEPKPNKVATRQ